MPFKVRQFLFLNILIIWGLFSAGLNPLCAGSEASKMLLEICSGLNFQVVSIDDGQGQTSDQSTSLTKCPQCFVANMAKLLPLPAYLANLPHQRPHDGLLQSAYHVSAQPAIQRYAARAPPYRF